MEAAKLIQAIYNGDSAAALNATAGFLPNAVSAADDYLHIISRSSNSVSKALQKASPWMIIPTTAIEGIQGYAEGDPQWKRRASEAVITSATGFGSGLLAGAGMAGLTEMGVIGTGALASGGTTLAVAGVAMTVTLGTKWALGKTDESLYGSLEGKFDADLTTKPTIKLAIDRMISDAPDLVEQLQDPRTHKIEYNPATIAKLAKLVNEEMEQQDDQVAKHSFFLAPVTPDQKDFRSETRARENAKILDSAHRELAQLQNEFVAQQNIAKGLKILETTKDEKLIAIRERIQRGYTAEEMNQISTPELSQTARQDSAKANTQAERDAQYLAQTVFDINANSEATRRSFAKQLQVIIRQQAIQDQKIKAVMGDPEKEKKFGELTKRAFEAGLQKAEIDSIQAETKALADLRKHPNQVDPQLEEKLKNINEKIKDTANEMAKLLADSNPDKKVTETDKSLAAVLVNNAIMSGETMHQTKKEAEEKAELLSCALQNDPTRMQHYDPKILEAIRSSIMEPDGVPETRKQEGMKYLKEKVFKSAPELADQYVQILENTRDEAKFNHLQKDPEKVAELKKIMDRIADGYDHTTGDREAVKTEDKAKLAQLLGGKKSDEELADKWIKTKEQQRDETKFTRLQKDPEQMAQAMEIMNRVADGYAHISAQDREAVKNADATKLAQLLGSKKDGEIPGESDKQLAASWMKLVTSEAEKVKSQVKPEPAKPTPAEKVDAARQAAEAREKAVSDLKQTVEHYAHLLVEEHVIKVEHEQPYVDAVMSQTKDMEPRKLIDAEAAEATKMANAEVRLAVRFPTGDPRPSSGAPRAEQSSARANSGYTLAQHKEMANTRRENRKAVFEDAFVPLKVTLSGATPGGQVGNKAHGEPEQAMASRHDPKAAREEQGKQKILPNLGMPEQQPSGAAVVPLAFGNQSSVLSGQTTIIR